MISFTPIRPFVRYVARQSGPRQRGMPQSTSCFHLSLGCVKQNYAAKPNSFQSLIGADVAKQRSYWQSLTMKSVVRSRHGRQKSRLDISLGPNNMNLRLLFPKHGLISRMKWSLAPLSWATAGLVLGLSVYGSTTGPAYAEARQSTGGDCNSSPGNLSHGKKVQTDYSVIGIPGDGRCLFRAVAHGACIRSGKPAPSETHQRELADKLRAQVVDEFVKRREETEWFIEGDFDTYVSQIRKTHVWGGEPELLMASHVLKMPITVYMKDEDCGGLISIAEYGQEYGKKDPIRVLYHGFGHYDALHIPRDNDSRSRL